MHIQAHMSESWDSTTKDKNIAYKRRILKNKNHTQLDIIQIHVWAAFQDSAMET